MVCGPSPKVVPETSGLVGVIAPTQASVAVGAVQMTTAVQVVGSAGAKKSAGQPANTGAVLSVTVTVNEQMLWFPFPSSAV